MREIASNSIDSIHQQEWIYMNTSYREGASSGTDSDSALAIPRGHVTWMSTVSVPSTRLGHLYDPTS